MEDKSQERLRAGQEGGGCGANTNSSMIANRNLRNTARQPPRARKFTKKHINKSSIYYILKTYHIAGALAGCEREKLNKR